MERKESTWTVVPARNILNGYGVSNVENVTRAIARIMQFESQFSFSQRLDIIVYREDHTQEYIKYKILDDSEEAAVKKAIPGVKTLFRHGV